MFFSFYDYSFCSSNAIYCLTYFIVCFSFIFIRIVLNFNYNINSVTFLVTSRPNFIIVAVRVFLPLTLSLIEIKETIASSWLGLSSFILCRTPLLLLLLYTMSLFLILLIITITTVILYIFFHFISPSCSLPIAPISLHFFRRVLNSWCSVMKRVYFSRTLIHCLIALVNLAVWSVPYCLLFLCNLCIISHAVVSGTIYMIICFCNFLLCFI